MAKIQQLPSGAYRIQCCVNHVRKNFTGYNKRELKWEAAQWEYEQKQKKNPDNITVYEVVETYISLRSAVLSPSTVAGYTRMLDNNFTEIKDVRMGNLNENKVQKWINGLSKNLSPKSVRNIYGLFRAATKINYDITMAQKVKVEYATPSVNQLKDIFMATKDTEIELAIILAAWCGLRISEVRGLKWCDVTENEIKINEAIVDVKGKPVSKTPKTTNSTRNIAIPPYIYNLIKKQPHKNDYVVPYTASKITNQFYRILKNNNINHCRFHDLRHVNASIMLMLGVPDKYAMKRGGWATERIMKDIYQQTFKDEESIVNNKIDDYFFTLTCADICAD